MAGFFGLFDYTKEGPGVYANEPPKGPVKTFFAILGRKFWKVITLNMMYVILSLPVLVVAWLAGSQIFPAILPGLTLDNLRELLTQAGESVSGVSSQVVSEVSSQAVSGAGETIVVTPEETAAILFAQVNMIFSFALIGLQIIVLGPVHAGITYIFRNYAREEHAFIWGDFKEHLRKNWKQSLLTSIISFAALLILTVNYSFYSQGQMISSNFLKGILTGAIVVISILFAIIHMYIYPMMVTFKLTIRQLYKNSLLLTMARLPHNIGIILLSLLITLVIPMALVLFAGNIGIILIFFYYLFVGFGFNMLLTNFFVYRQLKKYMIDPMQKPENEDDQDLIEEEEEEEKEESELPEG